jgi:hypothetical protein
MSGKRAFTWSTSGLQPAGRGHLAGDESVDEECREVHIAHHCPPKVPLERVLSGQEAGRPALQRLRRMFIFCRAGTPDELQGDFVRERERTECVPPTGHNLKSKREENDRLDITNLLHVKSNEKR